MIKAISYAFMLAVSIGVTLYGLRRVPLAVAAGASLQDVMISLGIFVVGRLC
jgi:hypothetical protein